MVKGKGDLLWECMIKKGGWNRDIASGRKLEKEKEKETKTEKDVMKKTKEVANGEKGERKKERKKEEWKYINRW